MADRGDMSISELARLLVNKERPPAPDLAGRAKWDQIITSKRGQIGDWLNGRRAIGPTNAKRLGNIFNVPADRFLPPPLEPEERLLRTIRSQLRGFEKARRELGVPPDQAVAVIADELARLSRDA